MHEYVIGIGAQKCATTWTYEVLRSHPQIRMSGIKELHFFSRNYDRGMDWYEHQFGSASTNIRGEISTTYLYDPLAPERISAVLGQPRLILNIRNPVDRLISHYKHLVRDGVVDRNVPPAEAISSFPELLTNGQYGRHLKRYIDVFPRESVLVVSAEAAASDPESVTRCLFEYAGVSQIPIPDIAYSRVSAGVIPRNQSLENARRRAFRLLKGSGLGSLISLARRSGLSALYRNMNRSRNGFGRSGGISVDRGEIWGLFRESVDELEDLMERRFPEIRE